MCVMSAWDVHTQLHYGSLGRRTHVTCNWTIEHVRGIPSMHMATNNGLVLSRCAGQHVCTHASTHAHVHFHVYAQLCTCTHKSIHNHINTHNTDNTPTHVVHANTGRHSAAIARNVCVFRCSLGCKRVGARETERDRARTVETWVALA